MVSCEMDTHALDTQYRGELAAMCFLAFLCLILVFLPPLSHTLLEWLVDALVHWLDDRGAPFWDNNNICIAALFGHLDASSAL